MDREIQDPNLPLGYRDAEKLKDGTLAVYAHSDIPGVRAHGIRIFRPDDDEYKLIVREIGELKIGERVVFTRSPTPEEQAWIDNPRSMEELKKAVAKEAQRWRESRRKKMDRR